MGNSKLAADRPLSPHLQIYRPMLTMLMSIAHRITGLGNAVGFLLLAWWLVSIAAGPEQYAVVSSFFASIAGRALLAHRRSPQRVSSKNPSPFIVAFQPGGTSAVESSDSTTAGPRTARPDGMRERS